MGLLDDAIREHLDLKRRSGADPTEIERLEREALGPVRRSPHEAPGLLVDDEGAPATAYPGQEDMPEWDESSDDPVGFDHGPAAPSEPLPGSDWPDDFDPGASESVEASPAPDRPSQLPRHHEIAEEWESHTRQDPPVAPGGSEPDETAPAPPPPMPASDFEQETVEHEVETGERPPPGETEPSDGDEMLEETPEFLQDTPEHDRLWFEQRPPRDFDFDG